MALADKARGQRIAQLRKRKHLTQQAMAEKLKIGYRTYQTWEAGTMPEWPNLKSLAFALGVAPEYIVGDDAVAPDPSQLDRIELALADHGALLAEISELHDDVRKLARTVARQSRELRALHDQGRQGQPPADEKR